MRSRQNRASVHKALRDYLIGEIGSADLKTIIIQIVYDGIESSDLYNDERKAVAEFAGMMDDHAPDVPEYNSGLRGWWKRWRAAYQGAPYIPTSVFVLKARNLLCIMNETRKKEDPQWKTRTPDGESGDNDE